jgi:transcriptional regulator with XRE-family HTH domain
MVQQLEEELREYDQLKSGDVELPKIDRLDQIAPFMVKLRIAKVVSQTELANRLSDSKQVISRYEESDHQTVGIARLQEILAFDNDVHVGVPFDSRRCGRAVRSRCGADCSKGPAPRTLRCAAASSLVFADW